MIIKKLIIRNFKSIEVKEVTDFYITGFNATGKSTILDAYQWLFCGKDQYNRHNKDVRPKDKDNNVNYECVVSVTAETDNGTYTRELHPVFSGVIEKSYKSDTTKLLIDEIEIKSEQWNFENFQILSNPLYFSFLDTKQRRKLLDGLLPDNIAYPDEYNKAIAIIGSVDAIDYKTVSTSKVNELKKELDKNKAVIENLNKLIDISAKDRTKDIKELESQLNTDGEAEIKRLFSERDQQVTIKSNINNLNSEISRLLNRHKELTTNVQTCPNCNHVLTDNSAEISQIKKRGSELRVKVKELEIQLTGQDYNKLIENINLSDNNVIKSKISLLQAETQRFIQSENVKKQISDVKAKTSNMASDYAMLLDNLAVVNKFIQFKLNYITDYISSLFSAAKVKMFEQQKNGGIKDVCDLLVDGIPFDSLNMAAKVNTGIELINLLSGIYNERYPIIVDNSESIDTITNTDSQLIVSYKTQKK